MKNRIRHAFTLFGQTISRDDTKGYMVMEPKRVIKDFADNIVWYIMGEVMKAKTREFNRLVKYMQRKMKSKCQTRDAKENALKGYWEKQLLIWFNRAITNKDEGMKNTLRRV